MNRRTIVIIILVLSIIGAWLFWAESKKVLSSEPISWTKTISADCGVVVTGGPGRVISGFDMLAQKRIKKLIISGVYPGASLREIFPRWPFYNLDKDDVILEKRSRTTYGNAQQTLPLVEALQCRDIVLITSSLHMYRAKKSFVSVFGPDLSIYSQTLSNEHINSGFFDVAVETTKSLFYSLWAY